MSEILTREQQLEKALRGLWECQLPVGHKDCDRCPYNERTCGDKLDADVRRLLGLGGEGEG